MKETNAQSQEKERKEVKNKGEEGGVMTTVYKFKNPYIR